MGSAQVIKDGGPFALLLALTFLVSPSASLADIYKWNDERGRIVVSNVPPAEKVRNLKLVAREPKPHASAAAATPSDHVATPTEQALLRRIETLERELQTQRSAYPPAPDRPPISYGSYYPPPPPTGYYGAYYPSYYPNYYYRVVPSYTYVASATTTVITRPVSGFSHGPAYRGGGGHRGRR